MAAPAIRVNRSCHEHGGKRDKTGLHVPRDKYFHITAGRPKRVHLLLDPVQVGTINHWKRGYPFYPVFDSPLPAKGVPRFHAGLFRGNLANVVHLHPLSWADCQYPVNFRRGNVSLHLACLSTDNVILMINPRIPTELIQLFSSTEATSYRIIPFEKDDDNILECHGDENVDYSKTIQEIAIIYDLNVVIHPVSTGEMDRALNLYYRQDRTFSSNARSLDITNSDFVGKLIEEADTLKSSDIHFEPYEKKCRVRFRIDGKLIERYIINKADYPALVNRLKILSNLDISEKRLPQDGRILFERNNLKFDVRVSVMPTIYGEKIVLRLLSKDQGLLSLSRLGFNEKQYADYHKAIMQPNGLILISGPTGSGKSTTLYATLGILNRQDNNILTIEDPVEYTLPGINQMQLKEEIGLTFGSALRAFLRQDPDIIMLGEIRDQDTAQMAIRSSLTGHLLLSTIHTNSAWGSITRLIDMGVHPYLISETLIACVAQRLIRLLCPHCKKTFRPDASFATGYKLEPNNVYYENAGCEKCYYTGYLGRKAIYEVILIDKHLSQLIRKSETGIDEYSRRNDIKTLKDSALELFAKGETSLEEILPVISETV